MSNKRKVRLKPRGRISQNLKPAQLDSLVKESDTGCVLLAAALLDDCLTAVYTEFMEANITDPELPKDFAAALFNERGPLGGFSAKTQIAYASGLVSRDVFNALNLFRKVRNEAAHATFEFAFDDTGVKRMVNHFTAWPHFRFPLDSYPVTKGLPATKLVFLETFYGLFYVMQSKTQNILTKIVNSPERPPMTF